MPRRPGEISEYHWVSVHVVGQVYRCLTVEYLGGGRVIVLFKGSRLTCAFDASLGVYIPCS